MVLVETKIKIDDKLLKSINNIAKRKNTTEDEVFNEVIEKGLESAEVKIPEYLIGNKNTYNPDPKRFLESGGIIKGCEPFDAVKLVREVRSGIMIFLDANYLVSYYIESEKYHNRSLEIAKDIADKEKIISRSIIAETINVLNNKLKIDKEKIDLIYKKLIEDYTLIEDQYFYNRAIKKTVQCEKRLPFFDFLYMALMEELEIEKIATFDKHFDNINGIARIY